MVPLFQLTKGANHKILISENKQLTFYEARWDFLNNVFENPHEGDYIVEPNFNCGEISHFLIFDIDAGQPVDLYADR